MLPGHVTIIDYICSKAERVPNLSINDYLVAFDDNCCGTGMLFKCYSCTLSTICLHKCGLGHRTGRIFDSGRNEDLCLHYLEQLNSSNLAHFLSPSCYGVGIVGKSCKFAISILTSKISSPPEYVNGNVLTRTATSTDDFLSNEP